jgi:hypothetical protein
MKLCVNNSEFMKWHQHTAIWANESGKLEVSVLKATVEVLEKLVEENRE